MIDLAIAMAMQDAELGEYGETLFWNLAPTLDTFANDNDWGVWVNSTTQDSGLGTFTDVVTISTRFTDILQQGRYLLHLLKWIRDSLKHECKLSTAPVQPGVEFPVVEFSDGTSINLDTVDGEGRLVKSVGFAVTYKLPSNLPSIS
jgi:hypothetical protein